MKRSLLALAATVLSVCHVSGQATAPAADPFATVPTGVPAPPPPPSAEDIAAIERLERMQQEFERQKRETVAAAVSKFNNAAQSESNAVDFYFACLGLVRSRTPDVDSSPADSKRDAKAEKEAAEAMRKSMVEDAYGTPGRGAALQCQLQYLVFTLEGSKITKRSDVIARYREFAGKAAGIAKTYATPGAMPEKRTTTKGKNGRDNDDRTQRAMEQAQQRTRQQILGALSQGVLGGLFSQAYSLQTYFKSPEKWCASPFDLKTMYEGHILPYYRETKATELNMLWDEYLGYLIIEARCSKDDNEYARWGAGEYKDHAWAKWLDIARHGNKTIAIGELASLVTQNPAHPGMEGWMQDLAELKDELIKPKIPDVPVTPEPQQ
jgi:hypothetical protein